MLLLVAWTITALHFQTPRSVFWPAAAAVAVLSGAVLYIGLKHRRSAWLLLALMLAATAAWWLTIRPSNDRDWAPDVAHTATADIDGATVVIHDVRNFDWRTETAFSPRWETRRYSLDALTSVDLVSSVWGNPAIAHTLISFGFSDGRHVVFSVEIRRERNESFSEIGGFFKEFELAIIAADEADIIRLRTDVRGEQVSLFPLRVTPEQARKLFLSYLQASNALARQPQFYQTLTTNCTTVIFQLARLVEPGIPADWRILLSGYLPDYLYAHDVLLTSLPLDETKRAAILARQDPALSPDVDFSTAIRARSPLYDAAPAGVHGNDASKNDGLKN